MENRELSIKIENEKIFEFFRRRMDEKRYIVRTLAKEIGVSHVTLYRNFNYQTEMSLSNFLRICKALQVKPYIALTQARNIEINPEKLKI